MFTTPVGWREHSVVFSLLAALLGCSLTGCGEPKYQLLPVEGVILWQDGTEPRELEGRWVEFETNGTVVAKAGLVADGTFRLDTPLPPGTYRVRIAPAPGAPRPPGFDPRYESFDTSGFTLTAASEPQRVTFYLKKRGR
jgi:hypothetical protein